MQVIYCCKKTSKTFININSSNHTDNDATSIPIEFIHKKMHPHDFYSSVFIINNQTKQISTFFPSSWTQEKVMASIREAYDNFVARGENSIPNKDGVYIIHGFTKENVKIEMYIKSDGTIDHAYPLFE